MNPERQLPDPLHQPPLNTARHLQSLHVVLLTLTFERGVNVPQPPRARVFLRRLLDHWSTGGRWRRAERQTELHPECAVEYRALTVRRSPERVVTGWEPV